jgi:hypothetical protein
MSPTVCLDSWNGQRYIYPIQLVHSASFLCAKAAGTLNLANHTPTAVKSALYFTPSRSYALLSQFCSNCTGIITKSHMTYLKLVKLCEKFARRSTKIFNKQELQLQKVDKQMQIVIDFYFLSIYSTCFERQALIIRSPSLYIQPPVSGI